MSNTSEDYMRLRGRCKELVDSACVEDGTLVPMRGFYFCPIWNRDEQHWWCVRQDGSVFDPSKDQFPSRGLGVYTPFDGIVSCESCGKSMKEDAAMNAGNYAVCSIRCYGRLVGVPVDGCVD